MAEHRTRHGFIGVPLTRLSSLRPGTPRLHTQTDASFRFDGFELDLRTGELRKGAEQIPIAPRSFCLLAYLIRQRARSVTREELFQEVWSDVTVNEGSLRQAIWELRQALRDDAAEQRYIRTVRGRGYRFAADVERCVSPARRPGLTATRISLTPPAPEVVPTQAMLGRTRELRSLMSALDDAVTHSGRTVLLAGGAGVGKSRLLHELIRDVRTRGLLCVEGSAERDEGLPPFWTCIQLVRGLADALPEVFERHLLRASFVRRLLESNDAARVGAALGQPSSMLRHRLFEELGRLLVGLSEHAPFVMIIDDVQELDEASLDFVTKLQKRLPLARILLALASRPFSNEVASARTTYDALAVGALDQRIELDVMRLEDVEEVLSTHSRETLSNAWIAEVHALTQGHATSTLEVARLLAQAPELSTRPVLESDHAELRSIVRRRLLGLPPPCLELARAVAVWGDRCSLAELSALVEQPREVVLARLDECIQRGVLHDEKDTHRFGFSHPMLREIAYETVPRVERCRLHQRAGRWLEREAGASRLSELVHHFQHAAPLGEAKRAIHYARRAGERAFAETAFGSAVEKYDSALRANALLDRPEPVERLEIELYRAAAMHAAGAENRLVATMFHDLATRADELGEPRILALVALALRGEFALGYMPVRTAAHVDMRELVLLERALGGLSEKDVELRALLSCVLSIALLFMGQPVRSEALAAQGLMLARQAERPALLARALTYRAFTYWAPNELTTRRATCDELVSLTQTYGLTGQEFVARIVRGTCALAQLDACTAAEDEARASWLAEQLDTESSRARVMIFSLWRAVFAGNTKEALRLSSVLLASTPSDADQQAIHLTRVHALAVLTEGSIRLPPAAAMLEMLIVACPDVPAYRCSLASVRAALGDLVAAQSHFDWAACNDFGRLPPSVNWLSDMTTLADAAVRLACPVRARAIYERLLPFAEQLIFVHGDALPAGSVARALAELAVAMGEFTAARAWLVESRRINELLAAPLFMQYDALVELKLLFVEGDESTTQRRDELVESVLSFAGQHGARWLEESVSVFRP